MAKEVETKFNVASATELRKALKRIGARFISRRLEKDIYYGIPCRPSSIAIRLRSVGKRGVFTVKCSSGTSSSKAYKVRDEFETEVEDAETFKMILKKLGFSTRFRKEKIRESYSCRGAGIFIDKLPHIGFYVEIEAPRARIKEIAGLLGLDMARAIPDTYMQLFNYYKIRHGSPGIELVFRKR